MNILTHILPHALTVVEKAAIAAYPFIGKGDEKAADKAAVDAMREAFNDMPIKGRIVIGEGERDEAPMLFVGEEVGMGDGPEIDIAVDPLEGTTLTAQSRPNALAVMALAERGHLLHAPDVYMQKIAVGPGLPEGVISLEASVTENIEVLADAKEVRPEDLMVCVLDRPRHAEMIAEIRKTGAGIKLISDGDVAAIIQTALADGAIDLYLGSGGAPEGVLAAAALRTLGGQMQGKLLFRNDDEKTRAQKIGIEDFDKIYDVTELCSGDALFIATGVTHGALVQGVDISESFAQTESLVFDSSAGTVDHISRMRLM